MTSEHGNSGGRHAGPARIDDVGPGRGLNARTGGVARSLLFWCLALAAIAWLQFLAERTYVKPYDEGLILYGASVVAHGGVPYRDFWSMYGPGSFYALAAVNLAFGESVLVGRVFDVVFRSAIILLVGLLVRRQAGTRAGLACGGLAFVLLVGVREYLFPALPATAAALLALLALDQVVRARAPRPRDWVGPGAAVGLTLLFRHDFGLSALLACGWALWLHRSGRRVPSTRMLENSAAFMLGVVAVAGPLYVYLCMKVPIAQLFDQLVRIPVAVYANYRSMPFPRPWSVVQHALGAHSVGSLGILTVYFPIGATLAGAVLVVGRRDRVDPSEAQARCPRALYQATFLLLAFFCIKGCVRVEVVHMLPAMLLAIVFGGLSLTARTPDRGVPRGLTFGALGLVAALGVAWGGAVARAQPEPPDADATTFALLSLRHCPPPTIPRLGCFSVEKDRSDALKFLAAHAQPGDTLYVGPGRHDKILLNNVEMYFLSGLPAATRWADVHPGVQTTLAIQQTMIEEFKRHPPAFVVANTAWDDLVEPNASRLSSGVTVLDDYLHRHYAPALTSGKMTVSVRSPDSRP